MDKPENNPPKITLNEAEREALVWKIAEEATERFWTKLKRPGGLAVAAVAIVLAGIGFSGPTYISGLVRQAIDNKVDKEKQQLTSLKSRLVEASSDSAEALVRAKDAEKKANDILAKQRETLRLMHGELASVVREHETLKSVQRDIIRLAAFKSDEDIKELAERIEVVNRMAAETKKNVLAEISLRVKALESIAKHIELVEAEGANPSSSLAIDIPVVFSLGGERSSLTRISPAKIELINPSKGGDRKAEVHPHEIYLSDPSKHVVHLHAGTSFAFIQARKGEGGEGNPVKRDLDTRR